MDAPDGELQLVHNSTEEIIELLLGPPGDENIHRSLSLGSEAPGPDFVRGLPDTDEGPPTLARCLSFPEGGVWWRGGVTAACVLVSPCSRGAAPHAPLEPIPAPFPPSAPRVGPSRASFRQSFAI